MYRRSPLSQRHHFNWGATSFVLGSDIIFGLMLLPSDILMLLPSDIFWEREHEPVGRRAASNDSEPSVSSARLDGPDDGRPVNVSIVSNRVVLRIALAAASAG